MQLKQALIAGPQARFGIIQDHTEMGLLCKKPHKPQATPKQQ